jgi:hypothetical protein
MRIIIEQKVIMILTDILHYVKLVVLFPMGTKRINLREFS